MSVIERTDCIIGGALMYLLQFEVFPLRKHDFVPYHLHALLGVHCQVGVVNARDVALIHLFVKEEHKVSGSGRGSHPVLTCVPCGL